VFSVLFGDDGFEEFGAGAVAAEGGFVFVAEVFAVVAFEAGFVAADVVEAAFVEAEEFGGVFAEYFLQFGVFGVVDDQGVPVEEDAIGVIGLQLGEGLEVPDARFGHFHDGACGWGCVQLFVELLEFPV
jgi:hypothetical protein